MMLKKFAVLTTVGFSLSLSFSLSSSAFSSPLAYLSKTDRNFQSLGKVLLETEEGYLYRTADSDGPNSFKDLYYINLSDGMYDRLSIESLGSVVLMMEGRFAVLRIAPQKISLVSTLLHDARAKCGQLIRLEGDAVPMQRALATAVPLIPVTQSIPTLPGLHAQVSAAAIEDLVTKMSSLSTRYAKSTSARDTTDLLVKEYSAYTRNDISVTTFAHKSAPNQPSVIVRIEGSRYPNEVVVVGSHIDSIATPSSRAPGADDNASGTASHFEAFRVILENNLRFDRTIEIHGYAAEELGLVGSQDIAKKYAATGVKVIAMLQNDMNMYREGDKDVIWLITNDTNARLTSDVAALVRRYQDVELHQGRLSAGSSDHAAWTRQGFPAVFPTENPTAYNHAIHTSRDTIANSGKFSQSAEFSKLTLSFLAHFAGLQD
jgi:leucyl aminopeptidase